MNPFAPLGHRHIAEEQMDAPDLPEPVYRDVLHDLARVNAATMAARPTIGFLDRMRERHATSRPWRILDVGFGEGDMLRRIAQWSIRRGQPVDLVGIDLNPNSAAVARAVTPPGLAAKTPIAWRTGDYRDLSGQRWDIIMSSLVAHHMDGDQRSDFIDFMERESALGWFVNDLHRHRLAFIGFPLLARLLRAHPIVRADGQLSIARSFRRDDWEDILADCHIAGVATIARRFPFRLCVSRIV